MALNDLEARCICFNFELAPTPRLHVRSAGHRSSTCEHVRCVFQWAQTHMHDAMLVLCLVVSLATLPNSVLHSAAKLMLCLVVTLATPPILMLHSAASKLLMCSIQLCCLPVHEMTCNGKQQQWHVTCLLQHRWQSELQPDLQTRHVNFPTVQREVLHEAYTQLSCTLLLTCM